MLSCVVVCVILRLAVLVKHRLVMDGQTEGHRAMASRPTADAWHRAVTKIETKLWGGGATRNAKITNFIRLSLPPAAALMDRLARLISGRAAE